MSGMHTIRKATLTTVASLGVMGAGLLVSPAVSFAVSAPAFGQQLPVSAITRTTATVSAMLNPEESATTYEVLYGTASTFGQHTPEFKAGEGSSEETVSAGLTGLVPGTTYHYEFIATNGEGSTPGPEETFMTAPSTPPTVATGDASNITLTSATVSGTIGPEGLATSYELDLGINTTYGTSIYGEAGSGSETVSISVTLQNLAPGTTYHYRLDAINSDGRAYGADQTFTTPAYNKPITLPTALPLLATPTLAFPTETNNTAGKPTKRSLTKAQKLARALKACRREARKKRAVCERRARKKYAPAKNKHKKGHKK